MQEVTTHQVDALWNRRLTDHRQTNEKFCWKAHPARQRLRAAIAAASVIVCLAAATAVSFGTWWGIAAAVILIIALNRFCFPSSFEMDHERITARYPLRTQSMKLSDIRRFVHDQHGGYLSTRAKSSRMDAYTGMHLLFDANRAQIIARIEETLKAQRVQAQASTTPSHASSPAIEGGAA